MNRRASSRILLSSPLLLRQLSLHPAAYFSSDPRRRGSDRRTMAAADDDGEEFSDELFLRSLDFGNEDKPMRSRNQNGPRDPTKQGGSPPGDFFPEEDQRNSRKGYESRPWFGRSPRRGKPGDGFEMEDDLGDRSRMPGKAPSRDGRMSMDKVSGSRWRVSVGGWKGDDRYVGSSNEKLDLGNGKEAEQMLRKDHSARDVDTTKEEFDLSGLKSPPQREAPFKVSHRLSDTINRWNKEDSRHGGSIFDKLNIKDIDTDKKKVADDEQNPSSSDKQDAGDVVGDKKGKAYEKKSSLFEKLNIGNLKQAKVEKTEQIPPTDVTGDGSSPEDADEIFRKMKETGLIPNAVAMLDGLCKDGLIQEAMKLFGLMREKGTIPEVVIYTAVVGGFCKATKFDDAKRVFRKMQANDIVPNAFSYQAIIGGLCKGKRLEDAVEFCTEMLDAGHSPNARTLTDLVDGLCNDKGVEGASIVFGRLKEKGLTLDEKALREHLDKKGPFSPTVWEVIFGKKTSKWPF